MSLLRAILDNLRAYWRMSECQWETTKSKWKDRVSEYFEKEYWKEWQDEMPKSLKVLENLQHTLDQAEINTKDHE